MVPLEIPPAPCPTGPARSGWRLCIRLARTHTPPVTAFIMDAVPPQQTQSSRASSPVSVDIAIQPPQDNPATPNEDTSSGDLSPRRRVHRVVEKTADRLGRSLSGRRSLKMSSLSSTASKCVLSIGHSTRSKSSPSDAADGEFWTGDRRRHLFSYFLCSRRRR
jgi:hypothetical protein